MHHQELGQSAIAESEAFKTSNASAIMILDRSFMQTGTVGIGVDDNAGRHLIWPFPNSDIVKLLDYFVLAGTPLPQVQVSFEASENP